MSAVEAVQIGTAISRDRSALNRWQSMRRELLAHVEHRPALTGDALEAAIGRLAQMFPDNVQRVAA